MKSINIKLESFEGPLDLLFHLIEKNKIDIYDIPIAELTEQYLEYINMLKNRDMDSMSEFLLMAATLIEIKSKLLLPNRVSDESEAEADPREELVNKLIEYKRFKHMAEVLKQKEALAETVFFKKPDLKTLALVGKREKPKTEEILEGISLRLLYKAFEDVLKRQENRTDKIRSKFNSVSRDMYTVEDKISYIQDLLDLKNEIKFSDFFKKTTSKSEIVVTFLAMLELIKTKYIIISQKYVFSEIFIKRTESLTKGFD